jgi:hypothetical protein
MRLYRAGPLQELTFYSSASKVGALLRAADDEPRQTKHNSLADNFKVETKALADLKVENAAAEGQALEGRG